MRCESGVCEELRRQISDLEERVDVLTKGINAVDDLIKDSRSVAGLHRNGDNAPWDELLRGGRYESCLADFSDALDMVAKYATKETA